MKKRTIIISVAVVILLIILLGIKKSHQGNNSENTYHIPIAKKLAYEKINIIGEDNTFGVYDPSVEYDNEGVGWMVYSSMNDNRHGYLDTHLAKSLDHGKTWKFVNTVNQVQEDNLVINNKILEEQAKAKSVWGVWRHETPTLVYDADDPDSDRKWKLFWIKTFSRQPYTNAQLDNNIFYGHSLIMYKYAETPKRLADAKEIPLFNSQPFSPKANYNLNELNPSKDNFFFYMEPGVIAYKGILYLAIQGSPLPPIKPALFLFSSKNHGQNWEFVKTLINSEDAKFFDYESFTAPSIVKKENHLFLLVSPVKKKNIPLPHLQYSGIYVLKFENIVNGKLERDNKGNLIIQKYIPPLSAISVGGGQSDYDEQNIYGGIVMAQSAPKEPKKKFQIYSTKQNIVDKEILSEKECLKRQGKWMVLRDTPVSIKECNLPTSDSGKRCVDSSQCESYCNAENTENQTGGECYGWQKSLTGCVKEFKQSKIEKEVCY